MSQVDDGCVECTFNTRRSSNRQISDDQNNLMDAKKDTSEEYGFLNYRNVKRLRIGRYEFDTWFGNSAVFSEPMFNKSTSKYEVHLAYQDPKEQKKIGNKIKSYKDHVVEDEKPWIEVLYFCCYCFKFTDNKEEWECHQQSCKYQFLAPGKVMYDFDNTVIRRISGFHHKLFCQCMCLLAKFFLDNKSIFYYVDNFDFYVIYKVVDDQLLPMGFYSRELLSWENNNLSCICVFPCYQKHHLGALLIDFSYALSKHENQVSGPEHPLSELGQIAYLKYWCRRIYEYLCNIGTSHTSLEIMSQSTGIRIHELLDALSFMGILYKIGKNKATHTFYSDHKIGLDNEDSVESEFHVYLDRIHLQSWIEQNMPDCLTNFKGLNSFGFKFHSTNPNR